MTKKLHLATILLIAIVSCSKNSEIIPDTTNEEPTGTENPTPPDNEPDPEPEPVEEPTTPIFDVSILYTSDGYALAGNSGSIMQANVNSETGVTTTNNLTSDLGIEFFVTSGSDSNINIIERSLFLNTWQWDESRFYMKNLGSGEQYANENICAFDPNDPFTNRIRLAGGNSNYVFKVFGKYQYPQSAHEVYYVNVYDLQSNQCRNLEIPNSGEFQPIFNYSIHDKFLAVSYIQYSSPANIYHITLIDLEAGTILKTIDLYANETRTCTVNNGKLYIFQLDKTYKVYDIVNDNFSETRSAENIFFASDQLEGKLFNSKFEGDFMLGKLQIPGPALHPYSPVIYNLETDEIVAGLDGLIYDLESYAFEEYGLLIQFNDAFDVDMDKRLLAICYTDRTRQTPGGVIFCNYDGTIYNLIPLDFKPQKIAILNIEEN